MHVRSGNFLVLRPLLAMNAPRQSVAREVTSIVTFVCESIPDQLLFLGWCRSVGDIWGHEAVLCRWDGKTRAIVSVHLLQSGDMQNCEPYKCTGLSHQHHNH